MTAQFYDEIYLRSGMNTDNCEGYFDEEIRDMDVIDLRRISNALEKKLQQTEEYRIFFTTPFRRCIIQQKILALQKYVVRTWQQAEKLGCLSQYFSGRGAWPVVAIESYIEYADDIEDYYNAKGINSYAKAVANKVEKEYFSGIGLFPAIQTDYRVYSYAGDYDEYIKSLSYEEYFLLLKSLGREDAPMKDNYEDPATFIGTACGNFADYFHIIKDLPDPIYIPGDGVGIASYICYLHKKRYFSSEPNGVGREAVKLGLITEKEPFLLSRIEAHDCKSIFFGNNVRYIPGLKDVFFSLVQQYVVAVVDRGGLWSGLVTPSVDMVPLSDYSWINVPTKIHGNIELMYSRQFFFDSAEPKFYVALDDLAEAMLYNRFHNEDKSFYFSYDYSLPYSMNENHFLMQREDIGYLDMIFFRYMFNYPVFLRDFARMTSRMKGGLLTKYKARFVYASTRERFVCSEDNVFSLLTRSFLNDRKHGRPFDDKTKSEDYIYHNPFSATITSNGYERLHLSKYDRSDTIENYVLDGTIFKVKVANPLSKKYVSYNDMKIRVMYVGSEEGFAKYVLLSEVVYRGKETQRGDKSL